LTIGIDDSFPSIPIPNEGDWLSIQQEAGQTVKQFERSQKTRPRPSSVHSFFHLKKNHFVFNTDATSFIFNRLEISIVIGKYSSR